jgi:hypothetical protein
MHSFAALFPELTVRDPAPQIYRDRIERLRAKVGTDSAGRLACAPISRAARSTINQDAFRKVREHWRLLAEIIALEFELARRERPNLTVPAFLEERSGRQVP